MIFSKIGLISPESSCYAFAEAPTPRFGESSKVLVEKHSNDQETKCQYDFAFIPSRTITPKPADEHWIQLDYFKQQEECVAACCFNQSANFTCYGAEWRNFERKCLLYEYDSDDVYLVPTSGNIFMEKLWTNELHRPNPKVLRRGEEKPGEGEGEQLMWTEIGWAEVDRADYYLIESFSPRYGFPYSTTQNVTKISHYLENQPTLDVLQVRGNIGKYQGYHRESTMHVIVTAMNSETKSKAGFLTIPLEVKSVEQKKLGELT